MGFAWTRLSGTSQKRDRRKQTNAYRMLNAMQSPEQKAEAQCLFEAIPEELGQSALRGYRKKAKNSPA